MRNPFSGKAIGQRVPMPEKNDYASVKPELYSAEQMVRYGEKLARSHRLTQQKQPYYLLKRLNDNEVSLAESCEVISQGDKSSRAPAGEWLLDNFYLIEEQIRLVRQLLPFNFGKGLPQIALPHYGPRIYDIATEAIVHSDAHWDLSLLARFITAYQTVSPLTLGELWALPGMLRLALIENLHRVAIDVAHAHQQRALAEEWVKRMLECEENDPANLIVVMAEMVQSQPPESSAFIAEMIRGLQGHGSRLALPLLWVEKRIAEAGLTSAELVNRFNQQLSSNQLSVSNSISGLRQLNEINWADFAESVSLVEQCLRQDPADIYAQMHFDTRDNYRHHIEVLARHSAFSEEAVARKVVVLAGVAPAESVRRHVGYYLVGRGRAELDSVLNAHFHPLSLLRSQLNQTPLLWWLGSMSLLVMAFSTELLFHGYRQGMGWSLLLLTLPVIVVVSQFTVAMLSETLTRSRKPEPLPRMDFSAGIPATCQTLVVIPCQLGSEQHIDALVNHLHICYLGNAQPNLYYALLTDFHDSAVQQAPEHPALLAYAANKIGALNRLHPRDGAHDRVFTLLHREIVWNPAQGVWMGYERKRGKLYALHRWLRGQDTPFSTIVGASQSVLAAVKYIITLDSDTLLPREMAHQMIAAMAHPLNLPVWDAHRQRVTEGYAILQPRLAEEIPTGGQGRYAALCSGEPGIDPYSAISSDIYQDLFGEGSFVGKGIYDVDMFMLATHNSCPENLVLSHDLLEGCYARSGLLSDAVLYEQYPNNYLADVARRYRWTRGDWQLLNWLRLKVRRADGSRGDNPLSHLSRWKLLDNLRRSLVAPSLLITLFYALSPAPDALLWLACLPVAMLLPTVAALVIGLLKKNRRNSLSQHIRAVLRGTRSQLLTTAMQIATMPHQSLYSLRAIAVTLWRLGVSHRYLHEWVGSDAGRNRSAPSVIAFYRVMWINPLAGILLLLISGLSPPPMMAIALLLCLCWVATPAVLAWLSRPRTVAKQPLSQPQRNYLRQIARENWAFFDTFVTAEENWLPPDNVQEIPQRRVAHRTSPTNIGLSLLATMTARDFGYLTQQEVLLRITQTLDTLDKLEHYRGHLYNWYDTHTLQPLHPRYVSSVDSGNLAGHLLTLKTGIAAWRNAPILDMPSVLAGVDDTLRLLQHEVGGKMPAALKPLRQRLQIAHRQPPDKVLPELIIMRELAAALLNDMPALTGSWLQNLHKQLEAVCEEWQLMAGWRDPREPVTPFPSLLWLVEQHEQVAPGGDDALHTARLVAQKRLAMIHELELRLEDHATMDFRFLYNATTNLLSVGYDCEASKLDSGHYDLLPSEIRLTNYVTIATNQLPLKSWFALGRLYTEINGDPVLMSWSGSMFEYLMPQLVMPLWPDTLLSRMCQTAVTQQIAWGKAHHIPWGISESAWYAFDNQHNYQYHAFGVPGLGLKRGLSQDMVIAPYATLLALPVQAQAAIKNLQSLEKLGAHGVYGFYEALDFTASRLPQGQSQVIIESWMAHHQGMGFLALSNLLLDAPMVKRFAANPDFASARLLLQERVPTTVELFTRRRKFESNEGTLQQPALEQREFSDVNTALPEVQLLGNGQYHLMVTLAGGGYSRWNNLALTRWRADGTKDNRGTFCYLSDPQSGEVWSNTWQPTGNKGAQYHALFTDAGAEFRVTTGSLSIHSHIVVSLEDDVELRRITLTHRGRRPRTIELTTYAEVVLAPASSELAHPTFSNLFVETTLLPALEGILCHRRPREAAEQTPWLFHLVAINGSVGRETSFETDRAAFIGRGRTPTTPLALTRPGPLGNGAGAVLDPIMAIRQRIRLKPGVPVVVDVLYGVSSSRDSSLALMEKYRDRTIADRVFEMAWSHSQVVLRQLNASEGDAMLFNQLASAVIFPITEMRADREVLSRNRRGQSGLWGNAISGDLPIAVLAIGSEDNLGMLKTLIQAHHYWQLKGLEVDLVILVQTRGGYQQSLFTLVTSLIASGPSAALTDKPGGLYVRKTELLSSEDLTLLFSAASLVLDDSRGSLADQLTQPIQMPPQTLQLIPLVPRLPRPDYPANALAFDISQLHFFNGLGGFSQDGREYCIVLKAGQSTPAPWSNILANKDFGSVISESGQAYSWFGNAHEYRITPWENDPVSDSSGEALYLRDEESGEFWSPTALPARTDCDYVTHHGFGYSQFSHQYSGIASELRVLVARDAPVKLAVLTLSNHSGHTRRLSVTGYVEWTLGEHRSKTALHVATSPARVVNGCGILATNHYRDTDAGRTAFIALTGVHCSVTGDRREFIGRNGSLSKPAALGMQRLSDRTGVGLDPCGAVQSATTIIDGDQRTFIFILGVGEDRPQAERLIEVWLNEAKVREELAGVHDYWHHILDKIQLYTPDAGVNLLANGWLLYQTLASRILARSGYYQSGGAWGFRDQLQDCLALSNALPERLREQILLCASRQFTEGDVQHWWHPPTGHGVRTRCSDDFLWLPLAISHYVETTGDKTLVEEQAGYLEARQLEPNEESLYEQSAVSTLKESVWLHGIRAIKRGLVFGEHGLPLMGSGDWNDGMSQVGIAGRGESVWLGFFLYTVLRRYAALAETLGDNDTLTLCRDQADKLQKNLQAHSWDGEWYLRGFFDSGEPLGSHLSKECQIDAIAQSWAVLSGAGDAQRTAVAMKSLDDKLVDNDNGLIKLLTPPFDGNGPDPGYIRGYLPGVRENGGQYTHGAIWAIMAFAEMGDSERAWQLFALINPINHSLTPEATQRYKVEPYVMAADVYSVEPHIGRGGWSWYTGSAGWTSRLLIEALLGIKRRGEGLTIRPHMPLAWPALTLTWREGTSRYHIEVIRGTADYELWMDGVKLEEAIIPLSVRGEEHQVKVILAG